MISIRVGKHCGHPAAFMSHTGSCGAGLNPASLPDHPRDRFRGERLAVNVPVKSPAVIFARLGMASAQPFGQGDQLRVQLDVRSAALTFAIPSP
jgi:hypothetical protein